MSKSRAAGWIRGMGVQSPNGTTEARRETVVREYMSRQARPDRSPAA
jgi:hypothetical protein